MALSAFPRRGDYDPPPVPAVRSWRRHARFAMTAIMLGVIVLLPILPTILAFGRDHPRRQSLALVNILFGWTLIGWVVVFLWALLPEASPGDA